MAPHSTCGSLILVLLEAAFMIISLVQFGSSRDIQPNTTWARARSPYHGDISSNSRIVGGKPAQQTDFPWMLKVDVDAGPLWETNSNLGPMYNECGGSIISHIWCLSAAHCFTIPKNDTNGNPDGFMRWTYMIWVEAGGFRDMDHSQLRNIHTQDGLANYLFIHPKYNTIQNYNYDIALMKVKEPWIFNERVSPISLADADDFEVGKKLTVSGYGKTCKNCDSSSTLLYVDGLNLIGRSDCMNDWGSLITENMICHRTLNKNFCPGDSGGAVITGKGKSNGPPYTQIGIVSWVEEDCGSYFAGVFTDVAKFRNWINEKMSSSNSEICEDRIDERCVEKAERGFCSKWKVYYKCKYSCACGVGTNPPCEDKKAKCIKWAAKGKCKTKKVYVNCKSSCACAYRESTTTPSPP